MPTLIYVGLKVDGEAAFKDLTGIRWMPGSSHEVSAEHAAMMLKHPDVWALAETVVPGLSDVDELAGFTDPEPMTAEPPEPAKRKAGRPRKDAA